MTHPQQENAAFAHDANANGAIGEKPGIAPAISKLHVLLVDDDNLFREALVANLINEGFDVTALPSGADLVARAEQDGCAEFNAIILDMKMPGMNGLEAMQAIRSLGVALPVIFLTNHTSERYERAALENGAVDFVDKTRNVSILMARLRIAAEGMKAYGENEQQSETSRIGDLHLNIRSARACWKDRVVPLTLTQFWIVHLLATNAGDYVPYRAIYDVVHGVGFNAGDGEFGYRVNVRSLIKRIRQRFRDVDSDFDEILNYPAFGYGWRTGDTLPEGATQGDEEQSESRSSQDDKAKSMSEATA